MCRCCSLTHSHKTAYSHRFSHHTRYLAAAAAVCLPTPTPPTDHYYSLHKSDTTQGVSVPCLSVPRRCCCRCGSGCACPAAAATTTTNSHAVVLLFVVDRFPQCVDAAHSHTRTTTHRHTSLISLFPRSVESHHCANDSLPVLVDGHPSSVIVSCRAVPCTSGPSVTVR